MFYTDPAAKAISGQGSLPVNRFHTEKNNSVPETRVEPRTANLYGEECLSRNSVERLSRSGCATKALKAWVSDRPPPMLEPLVREGRAQARDCLNAVSTAYSRYKVQRRRFSIVICDSHRR